MAQQKIESVSVVVLGQVTERLLQRVIKVRKPVQAEALKPVLKVVRCLCSAVFPSVVLRLLTALSIRLLISTNLKYLKPGRLLMLTALVSKGLIKNSSNAVKILGNGDLSKALKVTATKFSQSARDKIVASGGTFEETP